MRFAESKPEKIQREDQERLKWAWKNIPLKDLFSYFYSGSSGKSLDELREYIDAKRGHG